MTNLPSIESVRQIGAWLLNLASNPEEQRAVAPAMKCVLPVAPPDPQVVRRVIRQRQMRPRLFGDDLFADPAWDILLDLTAARAEHQSVSVSSLCIASGVPPTTALRWIGVMIERGLLNRVEDKSDRRRAFISLTDKTADRMARYFAEVGSSMDYLA